MMKQYLIVLTTCLLGIQSYSQLYGSFKDARDGKVYNTVKIGNQVWMTKNLNVSTFRNGDPIPQAKTDEEWKKAGENEQPAWCYYNNDSKNSTNCGKLYNWFAVNDPRGLAPVGFHIPSDTEWTILTDYLGGVEKAGAKMKSKQGWAKDGSGTISSAFSGVPGGYRSGDGIFDGIGSLGNWWSSSKSDAASAWTRCLIYNNGGVGVHEHNKEIGLYIRCIQSNSTKNLNERSKNENNFIFLDEDKLEPLPQEDRQIIEEKVDENKVYDEVDVDTKAEYFFGFLKWNEFVSANIDPKNINKKCIKAGTYKAIIGLVVNTKGRIQSISPLSKNGCGIEEEAIRVIRKAIKWEPAMKAGNYVTSYTKKIIEIKIEK